MTFGAGSTTTLTGTVNAVAAGGNLNLAGGTLNFASGTYQISGLIRFKSGVKYVGDRACAGCHVTHAETKPRFTSEFSFQTIRPIPFGLAFRRQGGDAVRGGEAATDAIRGSNLAATTGDLGLPSDARG